MARIRISCTKCGVGYTGEGDSPSDIIVQAVHAGWGLKNKGSHNEVRCPAHKDEE